ncbi:MAG: hypothetical protein M1838_003086 [Thelocarpon superellum]|nr:MAG: hypothetical protein M1838_003086 [Thelocarpon superellum]
MSTVGQFNTKSPTIKRILREAAELSTSPSPDYHAAPLETNLFEWHFTLRGPPAPSPYAHGLYHGRIVLPATYPLRPPSFRFLTPTGRFETNREICLSISGHHEETWQPAWGIRTALVALRSFMDQEAKGQVGGLDTDVSVRLRLAHESHAWTCTGCGGRSNTEIIQEVVDAAEDVGGEKPKTEEVPVELRLAYKDELRATTEKPPDGSTSATTAVAPAPVARNPVGVPTTPASSVPASRRAAIPTPTRPLPAVALGETQGANNGIPVWVDRAIGIVAACLFLMLARKVLDL